MPQTKLFPETEFQTPMPVATYMASLLPAAVKTVFEPTPGAGNLVAATGKQLPDCAVTAAGDFFDSHAKEFDAVIMNPPFNWQYVRLPAWFNTDISKKSNTAAWYFLTECLPLAPVCIALLPWSVLIDSDVRMRYCKIAGLKSITALPRSTFAYARVQTAVFEFQRGYTGEVIFRYFSQPGKLKTRNRRFR